MRNYFDFDKSPIQCLFDNLIVILLICTDSLLYRVNEKDSDSSADEEQDLLRKHEEIVRLR